MRTSLAIVVMLLLAIVGGLPVLGADAYTIANRPGIASEVQRAVSEALGRCIPFYTATMKIPLSSQVQVFIYNSTETFVQELQTIGREPQDRAVRWGRQATWMATGYNIFILQERLARQSANDITFSMCSAVGLILQNQVLTDRRAQPHQWLRQGHGFHLAALAMQSFGLDTAEAARGRIAQGLRELRERHQQFPRLSDMATVEGYQNALDRYGSVPSSYFLRVAAELLVSRSSQDAMVAYFRGLAAQGGTTPNPDDVFRAAFGMTVQQFQALLDAHLAALLR